MLYVTTRSRHDVYTAPVTLRQDRGADGGLFVPFRMPFLEKEDVLALAAKPFGQNVADVLNMFFSTKLTAWDVDMTIGRAPLKLKSSNYRIVIGELWNQIDLSFEKAIRGLSLKIHPDRELIGSPSDWFEVAVRIAVLFGIFGELLRTEQVSFREPMNIAVAAGSFAAPIAAWYARQMGLPVDTVICGCNENGAVWELLHQGEMDAGAIAIPTCTPECDHVVPPHLERLICGACGQEEVADFCWSCTEGATYVPEPEAYDAIRRGMFAAVVSKARVETIIPSVYRTSRYVLDPYAALAYGALADYRSRTGKSTKTLLLSEKSPLCQTEMITKTMHISADELKRRMAEV